MKPLKKIPFFLFLLVFFFCLHGWLENYGFISSSEVLFTGLFIFFGMLLLTAILFLFTKKLLHASLITFFIALWYLFFGAMHDWVKSIAWLHFMHSYSVILPLLLIVNIAYIFLLKRYVSFRPKLFFYLNILLLVYCLIDGFLLLNKTFNNKNIAPTTSSVVFETSKVTAKPNVYFIVFDCYAGYKSLQDSFGFKNDSLYNFLQLKYFKILPSFSNYNFTFFSMSSMLNMQYIQYDYHNKIAVQADMQKRINEIKNGNLFSIFNSMGYSIENYSIFDIKNKPGVSNNNVIVPMHADLITNKILHNRLLLDFGYLLYKFNYFGRRHIFQHDNDNNTSYNNLMASIEKTNNSPKFVYTHLLMPHAPYFKDSVGNYLPINKFNVESKTNYLSYLKYTNTIIKSIVDKITLQDSSALVLLVSDHGYNNKGSVRIFDTAQISAEQYTFNNLCAVGFPDKRFDSAKITMSNVNIFRYLFNAQFAQKIPYLKDSTVLVNHD